MFKSSSSIFYFLNFLCLYEFLKSSHFMRKIFSHLMNAQILKTLSVILMYFLIKKSRNVLKKVL